MKFQYDRRQLRAMCFVASLAPVTRLLPKAAAQLAGSASWLAPLCALPPLLLFLLILTSLMKMRREGEGLGEVIMRRSGRTAGAIAHSRCFPPGLSCAPARTGSFRRSIPMQGRCFF